ncbi:hypothetical protein K443DRAFT_157987 [Laccaria amethystina LaAM-08-1]|uniref:Homeobox domain-containing protein n=1 Tax=Laccaria amethystina LaAM-08-1 TaxID=1095629 RepID=A0A0C9WPD3_9AGAR|nr:hypothetical protein K443DRAFT_157987 [Laccaria amethystina LaAM-08-1]
MSDAALPEPASQPHEQEHSTSSPSLPQAVTSPSLVDGPQRKGRRFAEETTDYLKAWLHRHSDYPYPSEDEKAHLCHATGLSRTQLSGWMVKARRRHRAVRGGEVDRTQDRPDSKRLETKNHQSVEDFRLQPVPSEYRKEGCDWVVLYNPNVKETLDINLVHTFVHESFVCCVHFSADGRYLATGCNHTAQIFDTTTGEKVCVLVHDGVVERENLYIRCVRFSPDGELLVTGADDLRIRIWDIAKGRVQQVFDGHQREVYSLDFSRDGRFIISGSRDNTIRIWGLYDKFHKVLTINNDEYSLRSGILSVTISPDATLVAAGMGDTTLRIWDVASGILLERLRGHKDSIYSVAFTSDGKGLVSGSADKSVKYWDVSVLAARSAESQLGNETPTPTLSRPSSSSDRSVVPCTMDFVGHRHWVLSVSVTPDSRWVASGSSDRCVHFWDSRNASLGFVLEGHKNLVLSVDLSPMGGLLATGSSDHLARIWNYTTV